MSTPDTKDQSKILETSTNNRNGRRYTPSRAFRVFLMVVLAIIFILFTLNSGGRGFLPQSRRTVWIHAEQGSETTWKFSVHMVSDDFPEPPTQGVMIGLSEQSMGRTNPGFRSWRASHWYVEHAYDSSGSNLLDEKSHHKLTDDSLNHLLDKYVRDVVAPDSVAFGYWPNRPGVWGNTDDGVWCYWQHKTNWLLQVLVIVGSILISVIIITVLHHAVMLQRISIPKVPKEVPTKGKR